MNPTVGIFSFTGCSGCQLEIFHQEDVILDILKNLKLMHLPLLMEENNFDKVDIAIIEGCISTKEEEEKLKKIRDNSKYVIALGSCATHGGINAIRNKYDEKDVQKEVYGSKSPIESIKVYGIDKYIKVDYYLRGCPPVKEEFNKMLKQLLLGLKPTVYDEPVCSECRIKENKCLLLEGKLCLGPITYGGCNAICPSNNLPCDGCRGELPDANFDALDEACKIHGISEEAKKELMSLYNSSKNNNPNKKNTQ